MTIFVPPRKIFSPSPGRDIFILVLVMLAMLLPFVNKAFHIDDPLFIWTAQHIVQHPTDPYGFSVNWFGTESRMPEVMRNPPLAVYYIALAGSLFGWSEIALHLAFIIPSVACGIGIYVLARKWCDRPLFASMLSVATPVFILSSTTVMCDMMMLSFWVWAFVLWIDGIEHHSTSKLLLSALCISACILTKYSGLIVVLLIVVYTIVQPRSVRNWWKYLTIPLAAIACYIWFMISRYGTDAFFSAIRLATISSGNEMHQPQNQFVITMVFLGGCCVIGIAMLSFVSSKKILLLFGAVVITLTMLIHSAIIFSGAVFSKFLVASLITAVQFSFFFAVGCWILIISINGIRRYHDCPSIIIGATIAGVICFASFISWAVNGRYLLPIVPVLGILLVRSIRKESSKEMLDKKPIQYGIIIFAAMVSMAVTYADYTFANTVRDAALDIGKKYSIHDRTLWFEGHWGFQYYLESAGARPLDGARPGLLEGDILVIPMNNANTFPVDPHWIRLIEKIERPSLSWLATMKQEAGAGFYAHSLGPLPFVSAEISSEKYYVFSVVNPQK